MNHQPDANSEAQMPPVITLLTDFGLTDTYVGQMKGAILRVNPNARIVDLTHDVRPFAVRQGAFLLERAAPAFPEGTIHVAVVDPGVGGQRLGIAVAAGGSYFVGPDNGVLSAALPDSARPPGLDSVPVAVPADIHTVEIQRLDILGARVAPTFHGRDIFAPTAALLSLGVADGPGKRDRADGGLPTLPRSARCGWAHRRSGAFD
jgi:S-adenosyl-L-methionine hydrolase (adenosine-forming)